MNALDVIGDRDLRETLLFARARRQPVTADDVAAAHRIHRNVARARLERLTAAGLLLPSFERRTGRSGPGSGRPAKTYRVAPELSSIEFPERYYERLIALVAEAVPETGRVEHLHHAGAEFGRELGRRGRLRPTRALRTGAERVCAALGRLGYQAAVTDVSDDRALITTPTCPLRPLVCLQGNMAALDRGMWAGLLAAALEGVESADIDCRTGDTCGSRDSDCHVRLSLI